MSSNIPDSERDEVISEILLDSQNRICFDCGSKDPKWASPYLGILVCYECAARHRSYGTHISFIRSINLDKWKKNQIISMKVAGNAYAKERFLQLGIPQIGGIFDYQNDLIFKYRAELADIVSSILEKEVPAQIKVEEKPKEKKVEKIEENFQIEEEKPKKEEIKEPTKFEIKQAPKVKGVKIEGKAGKKNKIKKADFDFDFDSFNDVNFSQFNAPEDKKEEKEDNFIYSNENKEREEEDREREEDEERRGGFRGNAYNIKISKEEMSEKFKNKKAISSEDYAALEDNDSDKRYISHKLRSMGNSQAISSNDLYGNNQPDPYEDSLTDKMKDLAVNLTLKAAEKAKELKNKTNEMINMVQNKFNTGY